MPVSGPPVSLLDVASELNQALPFSLLNNPAALASVGNIYNVGNIGTFGVNNLAGYAGASIGAAGTAAGAGWSGNGTVGSPYTKSTVANVTNEYVGTIVLGYPPTQAGNPFPITVVGSFAVSGSGITCSMDSSGNVYATTTGTGFRAVRWQFNFNLAVGGPTRTIIFDINFTSTGTVSLIGGTIVRAATNPPTPGITVRLYFNSDGTLIGDTQPPVVTTLTQNWFAPTTPGIGSSYWIRATLLSGPTPNTNNVSPPFGVWYSLSGSPQWGHNINPLGDALIEILFEIATDAGGSNIVASGQYNFSMIIEAP